MPKFYKKKRNYRKRPYRKRNRIPRTTIPDRTLVKLAYVDQIALNPGIGGFAMHLFRANGMYDPDQTSTGHQPMGFDQWMAMYQHFTVVGSKITLDFFPDSATGSGQMLGGVRVSTVTATPADYTDLLEDRDTHYRAMSGSGTKPVRVTKKLSISKWVGVKNLISHSQYSGSSTADPSDQVYYQVFTQAKGTGEDPANCDINVKIEYIAVLREPKLLVGS